VVADTREQGLVAPVRPAWYFHSQQFPLINGIVSVVVRTQRDPEAVAAETRRSVASLDRDAPVSDVTTVERLRDGAIADRRTQALLLGLFDTLALVLAAICIYGVISYSVAQRAHEVGIRVALGAGRRDVLRLVLGQGMGSVLIGIVAGLCGALALTRVIASMLYGVGPTDALTFAGVSALLAAVALVANLIPARRALGFSPIEALRCE
jgi:putative ABC transport system permease protein